GSILRIPRERPGLSAPGSDVALRHMRAGRVTRRLSPTQPFCGAPAFPIVAAMRTLIVLGLVGFAAQLVDGSLGMAYGVTSTTLLLAVGTNPAAASATVHLAEIGTTLASGLAHWRLGNIDWKVVARIAVPGGLGAFAGVSFLSSASTEIAVPVMALILLALGLYVFVRFTAWGLPSERLGKPLRKRFLAPLGLVAGFVDATGGGGWGPVGTPAILASGRLEPRKVIGSIDASEFVRSEERRVGNERR